jgi:membrane protease YdiL (CAAX protease family)
LLALPFVFVIGVTAAWLVRRTRGLLAPMLLHALNNATAFATIAVATDVLNR